MYLLSVVKVISNDEDEDTNQYKLVQTHGNYCQKIRGCSRSIPAPFVCWSEDLHTKWCGAPLYIIAGISRLRLRGSIPDSCVSEKPQNGGIDS